MKLDYKKTVFVGLAFMSISSFWQLYNYIIPLILKNTFGVSDAISGYVMAADNLLAVFLLPLFGALSDRVNTRFGKRKPFIVVGTFLAASLLFLIPLADRTKNLTLLVVALGVLLLAMSSYRAPAVALMPDVTPAPLRSKGNAIINLMGALGGIMTYLIISLFGKSYTTVFAIVAGFMVFCAIVLMLKVPENKLVAEVPKEEPKPDPNAGKKMPREVFRSLCFILLSVFLWFMAYNAVETAYSRYVQDVWHRSEQVGSTMMIVAMLVATAAYLPVGMLSAKFGRKKVILFGVCLMAAAFLVGFMMPGYSILAWIIMGVIGIGWASINVNSYPMVVEMSKGSDMGKYTGLYYTFSMSAQILTPILSGYLFTYTPWGYKVLFPYAVIFCGLAILTMLFVRHGDNRPEMPADKTELFGGED